MDPMGNVLLPLVQLDLSNLERWNDGITKGPLEVLLLLYILERFEAGEKVAFFVYPPGNESISHHGEKENHRLKSAKRYGIC